MVTFDEDQKATVYEKRRVNGNFLEYLELEQFPFDTQVRDYILNSHVWKLCG